VGSRGERVRSSIGHFWFRSRGGAKGGKKTRIGPQYPSTSGQRQAGENGRRYSSRGRGRGTPSKLPRHLGQGDPGSSPYNLKEVHRFREAFPLKEEGPAVGKKNLQGRRKKVG